MAYTREQIIQRVADYAAMYGIDQSIGVEQIRTESGFNPRAYNSGTGASGLGQFIPGTWQQYGHGDPFDVDANLDAWGRLMRDLLAQFGGDYAKALIGYHSGPGAVPGVLRNPAGNPKSTAYYQGILARAGASASAIPTNDTDASQPSYDAPDDGSGLILPLTIGALILILILTGD